MPCGHFVGIFWGRQSVVATSRISYSNLEPSLEDAWPSSEMVTKLALSPRSWCEGQQNVESKKAMKGLA